MFFLNANREILHLSNVIDVLHDFANENPFHDYDLVIGSDSKRRKRIVSNVTVVFLWNLMTRKFRFFFSREEYKCKNFMDIYGRLIREATRSLEIAEEIENSKVMDIIGKDRMEVHLDIGTNGKSSKVLDTCVGMVKGYGYKCKVKPDAWIASCVADRYTR